MALADPVRTERWRARDLLPRSKWLYTGLDALLTAPLTPAETARERIRLILRPRSSNYRRVSALSNLLDYVAPGRVSRRLASALIDLRHFPLAVARVEVLAHGSGSTVFLIDTGSRRMVLKVLRRSLARPARQAVQVARDFQRKHLRLRAVFNGADEVVVPSLFLVLHGPLLGAAAAAVLQPYVEGRKQDIFLDYSVDEAIALLRRTPQLGSQWVGFAQRFLRSMEETGICFDLVGRENLMLVEYEGKLSLKIADNGVFDVGALSVQSPARHAQLQAHIDRLRQITEGVAR